MDRGRLTQLNEYSWRIEPSGKMRVPVIIYADQELLDGMDDKVSEQACNVATLPGIVNAAYAMPDAHWGYGFPIGGVAAFDADQGGIVSAGGVGFDISCGVRTLHTGLSEDALEPIKSALADKVKDVRTTRRLTKSPACLVADEHDIGRTLERILKASGQKLPDSKPILEINPEHPVITRLQQEQDTALFTEWSLLLFEQALLSEGGQLEDPAGFVQRLNTLLLRS